MLLPLLISAVAAAQAQSDQPQKSQASLFARGVSTADADGYYEGQHHDVVELAERKQTNCRYFG